MTGVPVQRCGPSSPELKTDIANFMERAEQVVAHPLGAAESTFKVQMRLDLKTGELTAVGFDQMVRPLQEWIGLAVLMRPIIFLEQDPISFNVLTKRIEREHALLRGRLKEGRGKLAAWRKYVFIAAEPIGTPGIKLPQGMKLPNQMIQIGPAGASPSGVDVSTLSGDYEYADAYLNANVWHSDNEKARDYLAARPDMKLHYAKCAELRTLSATEFVRTLRQWILDPRADGHDF